MPEIVYTDVNRDYPRGYYVGALSATKVRNAMKKRGYELVNAHNDRINNVLHGSFGFIKDPMTGRLVYYSADASFSSNILYRTAQHDKDWRGGANHYTSFESLGESVRDMFAHPEKWD